MRVLVTGTAGFIGYHVAEGLLSDGHEVLGIDGLTSYYRRDLKDARNKRLARHGGFQAFEFMLEDREKTLAAVTGFRPEVIVHLAAQAGVRYSIENPGAYFDANLGGLFALMEACRACPPRHFLFASTSSVYGNARISPFAETACTDRPISLYAATKKAGEAMLHSFAHIWGVPTTVFRFFTVYGPWGRPDMAPYKFVDALSNGRPIDVYNHGRMRRDFTYIDDITAAIFRLIDHVPVKGQPAFANDTLSPDAAYRTVNIGRGRPVELMDFIREIETALGVEARINFMPMQQGDVPETFASTEVLQELTGFEPQTSLSEGIREFVDWYRTMYAVKA